MRIPAEIVPPVGNLNREVAGDRKTEPVGSAAGLADELAASAQGQQPAPFNEREAHRHPAPAANAQEEKQPVTVERRQSERRSEKQPVLLDTRSNRGRRQAAGETQINIKV